MHRHNTATNNEERGRYPPLPNPFAHVAQVLSVLIAISAFASRATAAEFTIDTRSSVLSESSRASWRLLSSGGTTEDQSRAVECLTEAVYYEAGFESAAGQQAVAQVVLNRVKHPAFPKSVCGVVFQGSERPTGCQFTFTCDGSLARRPRATQWDRAHNVAEDALAGRVADLVGGSTHYHARWMVPYWRASMVETARIGGHIFYEMPSRWGGAQLNAAYAGSEPIEPLAPAPGQRPHGPTSVKHRPLLGAKLLPASPATFSVWGVQIATVIPSGHELQVQATQ